MATLAVGVDLGGTNARAALVDVERGVLVGSEHKAPVDDTRPEHVADLVARLVEAVDPRGSRAGVGVGVAGMLRGWTGVVINGPNFGWREVPLRAMLRDRLGPAVELYNDLNAIGFGEARFGGARGQGDVLCVYVGTGIGAGIVTGGRLYIGASHLAGEIGHVKVRPGGRLCGCGERGCIEAYASGRNIQARAREELATRPSRALELAGSLEQLHAGHIEMAAAAGDPYASALWEEVSDLLGLVLANAVTLLNPSRLVLGGGVWQKSPDLRRRTLPKLEALQSAPAREGFAVVDTQLGDNAGVLGSAALIALHPPVAQG